MSMRWHDLLFAHWPVPIAALRPQIPGGLELDTFEGEAWLGVVPFYMSHVRPRSIPSMPWLSHFLELNLRTYVTTGGKPGVWFFSLDAANPVAVRLARRSFHLPYFDARMRLERRDQQLHYQSVRTHPGEPEAHFVGHYQPVAPVKEAEAGTLEHFLTERYCLYSADARGRIYRGDIHHVPWPLQRAEAEIRVNTLHHAWGVPLPDTPPLLHFAKRLEVKAWLPVRADGRAQTLRESA